MLAAMDHTRLSCRILVVEDDPDDIFLLRRAFQAAGESTERRIEIRTVPNGLDAISVLVRQDLIGELPDVIVLDLNMPVMDGILFLQALRGELRLADAKVPTVVLTTSNEHAVHDAARQAGASAIYVKPHSEAGLTQIASKVVRAYG